MAEDLEALKVLTEFISDNNGYIPKNPNELVGYSCNRYDIPTLDDLEAKQIISMYRKSLEKVRKHNIKKDDVRGRFTRWWSKSTNSNNHNLSNMDIVDGIQILQTPQTKPIKIQKNRKHLQLTIDYKYDENGIKNNNDNNDNNKYNKHQILNLENLDNEDNTYKSYGKLYIFYLLCFVVFMLISTSFIGAIYSNTENNIIWRQYDIKQFNDICSDSYDVFIKIKNYDPGKTFEAMIITNMLHVCLLWMITTLLSLYIYYYSYLKEKEFDEYFPICCCCCYDGCCCYIGPIIIYFILWVLNIIFTHSVLTDTNLIKKYCNNDSRLYQIIVEQQYPFCLYNLIILYFQIIAVPSIILIIVVYLTKKSPISP